MALPIRGTRASSTHEREDTRPSHQEAYTSPWTNLTHQGIHTRSKRNYDPAACGKANHKHRKLDKNESTEKYIANEGKR